MTDQPPSTQPQVSDTPPSFPSASPPTKMDQWKSLIGDLARPLAIIVTSISASIAVVDIAHTIAAKTTSFEGAAIFIAAVFVGVGAIYGAKSLENAAQSKHSAQVEVAKAQNAGASS